MNLNHPAKLKENLQGLYISALAGFVNCLHVQVTIKRAKKDEWFTFYKHFHDHDRLREDSLYLTVI